MEELIDVLDENGDKLGIVATRSEVHRKGLWHKGVVVVLIDGNNNILLQQRSEKVEAFKNMWDASASGHVSAGQDSKEAAIRELDEEISFKTTQDKLKLLIQYKENIPVREGYIENLFFDCYIIRLKRINLEELKAQESEVSQMKLFSPSELKKLINDGKTYPRSKLYNELLKELEKKI